MTSSSHSPSSSRRPGHTIAFLALTGALSVGGLGIAALAVAPPAAAHNYLVSSTPADGATLTELPESFEVTTNDALLDLGGETGGFALQVVGPDGLYYGDGCVTVAEATMSAVPALGPAGAYTATWQVVSGDGHSVDGAIPFNWAPADTSAASSGSPQPPVCGAAVATPEPSPEASVSATAPPEATDGTGQEAADGTPTGSDSTGSTSESGSGDDGSTLALIIGGGVLAAAAGAAIIYLLMRRTKQS